MSDEHGDGSASVKPVRAGDVYNLGEPFRFTDVQPLAGVSAEFAKQGQQVKIWTKMALTSDESLFHQVVEDFSNVLRHMTQKAGVIVNLNRADTILLVLKSNATAELWVDTAAVSIQCTVKRPIAAGTAVFESDIADVTGMSFPCITFGAADKVICLFREGWRFGYAFDMNPEGNLDVKGFTTTLGSLYRKLRYKHLYDTLGEPAVFARLLNAGWFPFAEIVTTEFKDLMHQFEMGLDVGDVEESILAKFDNARVERILKRWLTKSHFASKASLLQAAITAFFNKEPIAVIKILLTEIEGVLNDAYRAAHEGQSAKHKDLLLFAEASAERKAGGLDTLFFPVEFGRYLREYTFANFDPIAQTGTAGSRHAVGHGAASQESYTMPRALQAILTLDQVAFYT
jgi:hypothetical protein